MDGLECGVLFLALQLVDEQRMGRRASGSLWACGAQRSVGVLEMGSSRAALPGYLTYPPIRRYCPPIYSLGITLFQ
jgi:hypothetical protein